MKGLPMTQKPTINRYPSVRPQISMILETGSFMMAPTRLDTTEMEDRRACFEKALVT